MLTPEQLTARLRDKEWFGEPCPDFNDECTQCLHWFAMDLLDAKDAEIGRLRNSLQRVADASPTVAQVSPDDYQWIGRTIAKEALRPSLT